jgi:predicted phosphodiesterase
VSKRRSQKRSFSQVAFQVMGIALVVFMVISLVLVALPSPPPPEPTAIPTTTPFPRPTATATLLPSPTSLPTEAPTLMPTEPVVGPDLPTGTLTEPVVGPELPTETPTGPVVGPQPPTETPQVTPTPGADAAPPTGGAFVFAVVGDSRSGPQVYRRILDAVSADGSEFLVHTGDLVNQGTEAQWLDFQALMAGFILPFYPVPGNHDSLNGKLDGYLRYSGAPAAHYSFDYGPLHLAMADSHNGGIGADELAWLRDDLSATDQPLKMVFLHHPPFDPDGSDHIMAYGNEPFMALMAEMGVDYVIAGHIHAYARAERDGVVYLYTGGGGAPLYTDGHPLAFHHYLRITVQGQDVSIEVVEI